MISTFIVYANDTDIEKQIYESFFSSLSKSKVPTIYTDTKIASLSLVSDHFNLVDNCSDAEIVIMTQSDLSKECQSKIVFGTRYRHLKQPYVIGAFFWQKGRPNIVFLGEKLEEKHITLDPSLEQFVE